MKVQHFQGEEHMEYDVQSIFDDVKLMLKGSLSEVTFDTFFRDLKPIGVEEDILRIETDQHVAVDVVNGRFHKEVQNCLAALGFPQLDFTVVDKNSSASSGQPAEDEKKLNELVKEAGMNVKYTFKNFVSGASNRLAYASSVAVADAPGTVYNPLYIWGPPGLGKTHLMQSIGHQVLEQDPTKKVLYISSETFVNEWINAIYTKSTNEFKEKYRKIDVLLIDDIQFLSEKESTQEAFFHTFNALYESNKQICISGDRPPEEIKQLEERIRSRFKWGMTADIKPPDYETRVAILQKKAENNNIKADISVLSYIAKNISSNIRELEGALTRVQAYKNLFPDREIDLEITQEALKDYFVADEGAQITIPRIINVVCERYNLSNSDIISKKKPREISYPRQIAMYLCRKMTEEPLENIGTYFGGRDHTTVIHAIKKIGEDLEDDKNGEFHRAIEDLERRIKGE